MAMAGSLICKELTCVRFSTTDVAGAGADDEEAGEATPFGGRDASSRCCWPPPPSGLGKSAGAMWWWWALFFPLLSGRRTMGMADSVRRVTRQW